MFVSSLICHGLHSVKACFCLCYYYLSRKEVSVNSVRQPDVSYLVNFANLIPWRWLKSELFLHVYVMQPESLLNIRDVQPGNEYTSYTTIHCVLPTSNFWEISLSCYSPNFTKAAAFRRGTFHFLGEWGSYTDAEMFLLVLFGLWGTQTYHNNGLFMLS